MADHVTLTTTVGTEHQARALCRRVVEQRLAACGQVVGPIHSTYWWQGVVATASEWLCVFKSRAELLGPLRQAVADGHGYENPEVVWTPLEGEPDYLAWVDAETRPAP